MTIEQTVEISVPATDTKEHSESSFEPSAEIENIRKLLQKEMNEKGTSAVIAAAGDGWEAHVREHYAESF